MATTNREIIMMEMALRDIQEEVHTFSKWKSLGYKVKKGEKALFQTRLWKTRKGKKTQEDTENNVDNNDKQPNTNNFFLAKSSMFSRSQVEPIVS